MSSASIKLISLNIERRRHLDAVGALLTERKPDVACLQELAEDDVERFAQILGAEFRAFCPMTREEELNGGFVVHGLGMFSRFPLTHTDTRYYSGTKEIVPETMEGSSDTYLLQNRLVLLGDIEKDSAVFRVGTTHFTWSLHGKPTDLQRADLARLLELLEPEKELVLCGDFNAPRGGEMFAALAAKYKDNIPAHYTSSLDPKLHRAAPLELMVDGLFTTPQYSVSDFEMVDGVSDHCALVATVSKIV